jgi:hypothetical protein
MIQYVKNVLYQDHYVLFPAIERTIHSASHIYGGLRQILPQLTFLKMKIKLLIITYKQVRPPGLAKLKEVKHDQPM